MNENQTFKILYYMQYSNVDIVEKLWMEDYVCNYP
jgi:hypothetical protein